MQQSCADNLITTGVKDVKPLLVGKLTDDNPYGELWLIFPNMPKGTLEGLYREGITTVYDLMEYKGSLKVERYKSEADRLIKETAYEGYLLLAERMRADGQII